MSFFLLVMASVGVCTNEIHLVDFPRGLYFIKVIVEDGKVYLDKVVKE